MVAPGKHKQKLLYVSQAEGFETVHYKSDAGTLNLLQPEKIVANLVSQTVSLSPLRSQLAAILKSLRKLLLQVSSSHTTSLLVHFSGLLWHHAQTSSL